MEFPNIPGGDGGIEGKHFIKLKDKESVVGVFRGAIHHFKQHWVNKRSMLCTGPDNPCKLCAEGNKSSFRFRLNFIGKNTDGELEVKLFEQGWTVFDNLKSLNVDYPLEKTFLKITRNGTEKNTSYMIMPIPNWLVPEASEKAMSALKLHDLVNLDAHASSDKEDDLPF